ncbi:MAG: preprotein translocase subunit SecE [Phycisphaerales bacterium]|jgi:preprotein translocase SecE subunit|nr:preprotein translocase subunit SecE [Phycisphaerales bacterium]
MGLYKPDQGYWVRVMTALGLAVLFLAGAAWAWQELDRFKLPTPQWNLTIAEVSGEPPVGQRLTLIDTSHSELVTLGEATIEAWTPGDRGSGRMRVGSVTEARGRSFIDAKQIKTLDGSFTADVNRSMGIPVFEPVYLKAGVAGAIIVAGLLFVYWFVGHKADSAEFLIATDAEMRKVNWSTRKNILDSTWVVIGATMLIGAFLFVCDIVWRVLFQAINVF